ncbi:hypothetical protein JCM3765_005852 [Sporobolomyces pararoseus]
MSSTLKGVQKPLKPKSTNQNNVNNASLSKQTSSTSSTSSTTSSSNPSLSLSQLGSFKRNKTPKSKLTVNPDGPSKRTEKKKKTTTRSTDSSFPSKWTNLQTGPFAPTNGGRVKSLKRTRKRPAEEAAESPWMSWLRKAAKDYLIHQQQQSKGKGKEKMTEQVVEQDEDEVLVGEQSWESPSERSATPNSNLDDPGPSTAVLPSRPLQTVTTTSQSPEPIQPIPPLAPKVPSTSRFQSSNSSSTLKLSYSPHSSIPQSTSSNWLILHCGGIPSTLSDLEIYKLILRNHQTSRSSRPIAVRISRTRRSDNTSLAFIAYETEKARKDGLEALKIGFKAEEIASGGSVNRMHVSPSNTPASEVKWFGTEMIEYWDEMVQKAELEEEQKKRKLASNTSDRNSHQSSSINQSNRPERRLPPPRPPPPAPPPSASLNNGGPPSQALLEALLSELRRSSNADENYAHQKCYYNQPHYPLVTYDPNLDPRRKRRKLV